MQFPFQTCSVTLTVVGVHSLWNEKFAANNLQTWAAHRAQNKPCIITLIGLAVCINSTCAHSCVRPGVRNWRRKLCHMQLKMWSWHTTCKVVFWVEHKGTQRSIAVFWTEHKYVRIRTQTPLAKKCLGVTHGNTCWSVAVCPSKGEGAVIYTYWPWQCSLIISPGAKATQYRDLEIKIKKWAHLIFDPNLNEWQRFWQHI